MADSFQESLRKAREAADELSEEELAYGLDGQHATDPQGGEERSNPVTSRVAKPEEKWTAEADTSDRPSSLRR